MNFLNIGVFREVPLALPLNMDAVTNMSSVQVQEALERLMLGRNILHGSAYLFMI